MTQNKMVAQSPERQTRKEEEAGRSGKDREEKFRRQRLETKWRSYWRSDT